MARLLRPFLTWLVAGAVLLLGLTGATLRSGRVDPLDWLLPGAVGLLSLLWVDTRRRAMRGWRPAAWAWLLCVLPSALLILVAGSRVPWAALLTLAGALAVVAIAGRWAFARSAGARWLPFILTMLLGAGRWALLPGSLPATGAGDEPAVGVISALPLYGSALAQTGEGDLVRDAGRASPLWQVLDRRFALRPLDRLDADSLAPLMRLLLAQPRQLAPEELVALDGWVRRGGHALILADPLLHWPDRRSLADPARAPLTSLLDPLLMHWGLHLEPADRAIGGGRIVTRRILGDGAMLQVAGASRFTLASTADAACRLEEAGLFARCAVGRGTARLVADADWINDALWTLDPISPHDRTGWVSDAIPILLTGLQSGVVPIDSETSWLIDDNRLISALRWALLLSLLLVVGRAGVERHDSNSHAAASGSADQKRNIGGLKPDSG